MSASINVDLNSRTREGLVRARAADVPALVEGAHVRVVDPVAGVHGAAVVAQHREGELVLLQVDWDSIEPLDVLAM